MKKYVRIYSNEHDAWWGDSYCGYTPVRHEAGIFDVKEVQKEYPRLDYDTTKEDYLEDVSTEEVENTIYVLENMQRVINARLPKLNKILSEIKTGERW